MKARYEIKLAGLCAAIGHALVVHANADDFKSQPSGNAGARVGDRGDVIGVDRFGASAPGPIVMREYGFSVENVCQRALALLEREHD